jgi:hypothetical protein
MRVVRQNNQTLLDIAIQYCGDAQAAFEIALLNDVSLNDSETITLEIPPAYNRRVVEYYYNNNIKPATATDETGNYIVSFAGEPIVTFAGEYLLTINY